MRTLTIALGLVLLVSGCTSDPAPPPPWTPVKHPPAQQAQDRDEKAVLGTLVNIDPCKLAGNPAGARLRYPHLCLVDLPDGSDLHVGIDDRSTHADRYDLGTKEVDGARVDAIDERQSLLCTAEVPVSFRYAVTIAIRPATEGPKCGALDEWAGKVVAGLNKPGTVRHPKDRPDLSKEACGVLAAARGSGIDVSGGSRSTIDYCQAGVDGLGGASFSMLIEPGPPEGGWGKKWATVAGKDVYIDDNGCQWTWSQGQYAGADNRLMTIDFGECERAEMPSAKVKSLLTGMIKQLAKPPVPGTVDRLTYRPDEPTELNPGACVDHPDNFCEPFQPTPVPAGADQVNLAASTDPHVMCAATVAAVHAQFPGLRPVAENVGPPTCSYVEPSHAVQLEFQVQDGSVGSLEPTTSRKTTIAGHPGEYSEEHQENRPPRAEACVDTGKADPEGFGENYFWCVTATFRGAKPDLGGVAKLEPLLAATAVKGFG